MDGRSENDDESCDARQPAGGTNILQSFEGLGFNENSKCAKHPPENLLLPGSWCFQLNGPPPPFEAFLFHGLRERLLRIGRGTCVPYKKGSSVPDREYSKLFDANGYYKLNGKRPEKVPEVEIGQKRSDPDPYATVQIESENSTLYDCPPEKKKPDCKKRESSVLGEASQQLLPVDGSTMGEVKRGINWALVSFSCMGEKELQVFRYRLTKSMAMKDFHPVATVELNSSASPSDVENILRVMHTLLTKDGNVKGLLIVILPEDAASHGKVKEVCENLGVIYVCCLPQNVRNPTDNYMQHIAYKILEAVPYNTHSDKDSSNDESGEDDTLVGSEVDNCEEGPVPRSSNFHAEETGEYEAKHGFSDQHDIDDTQVGLDEMEEVDISEEGTEAIVGSEHGSDQLSDLDIDDTQVGSDEMEEVDSSEEETGAIEGSKHVSDQLSDLQDIYDGSDEDLWKWIPKKQLTSYISSE